MNDKVYIGQTTGTLRRRKSLHLSSAQRGDGYYFQRALKKYGKNNFKWATIDFAYSKRTLDRKEKYWIKEYKSTNSKYGYNLMDGGGSGGIPNEVTRKKLSIANKGQKRSKEFCEKSRLRNLGWKPSKEAKEKNRLAHLGRHHTEEAKKKLSQRIKGHPVSEETKKKISDAQKGRKKTPEQIEKNRQAQLRLHKHLTDEQKRIIGLRGVGRVWTQESINKLKETKRKTRERKEAAKRKNNEN